MLSKELLKYIAFLIIAAGLVFYSLKRTGYIEGMETSEPSNSIKETSTIKRNIIS